MPIPRHLYGEMAKSTRGCTLLNELEIITKLLHDVKNIQNKESIRRAAFWALGHIGASETGYAALAEIDFNFMEWCVNFVYNSNNFSLRGTALYCLGMLSRSTKGCQRLHQLNWFCSPIDSNSAVALPQNISLLFQYMSGSGAGSTSADIAEEDEIECRTVDFSDLSMSLDISGSQQQLLTSLMRKLSVAEKEVVELIVKVSGSKCSVSE